MEALQSFEQWKEFLAQNVKVAQSAGASQESIAESAKRIGDYLAQEVNPANREQRLLAELWKVGDDSQRQALASMITKLVSDGVKH